MKCAKFLSLLLIFAMIFSILFSTVEHGAPARPITSIAADTSSPADTSIFPAPHNVTLNIGGQDVFFLGQDLNEMVAQYTPAILENATVLNVLKNYRDILLFMYSKACYSGPVKYRYDLFVGLNESYYVEVMIKSYSQPNNVTNVISIDVYRVLNGSEYLENMKSAWASVVAQNETLGLNISSPQSPDMITWVPGTFLPILCSSNFSLYLNDTGSCNSDFMVSYQDDESLSKLHELHWEFLCTAWVAWTAMPSSDPASWHTSWYLDLAIVSVATDGTIIQMLLHALTLDVPSSPPDTLAGYIPLIIVSGGVGIIAVVAIVSLRRRRAPCIE